jgi:hypothetical protein
MSHQDSKDVRISCENLKAVFGLLLPSSAVNCRRHGNAEVDTFTLAAIAIAAFAWSGKRTLTQRVEEAAAAVGRLFPRTPTLTRQGLFQALATCGVDLAAQVCSHILTKLCQLKGHWTTAGRPTFAIDGTKFAAPRTADNQAAFAVEPRAKNGRGKKYKKQADAAKAKTVQILLTICWHIGTGLPACWRLSHACDSEKANAAAMLAALPPRSRIVGDAAYVGHAFWSAMIESGCSFVVRVGSNITLLKNLNPRLKRQRDVVHCWPEAAQRAGQPPLLLRLIEVRTPRSSMWLLTNEFDLTNEQVRELYLARWGVEVFFRAVKQNCGKAKLLCRTPENVTTELTWILLGTWASLFVAKLEMHEHGVRIARLSPIQVMDQFAAGLTHSVLGNVRTACLTLRACVRADESHRTSSKQSRGFPRRKKHQPCGPPIIRNATTKESQAARTLE